jgi:hypothetical protein
MNLTAHPFVVAAELAWKQESLGRANLGDASHHRRHRRHGWHPWGTQRGTAGPRPQHRPRPA